MQRSSLTSFLSLPAYSEVAPSEGFYDAVDYVDSFAEIQVRTLWVCGIEFDLVVLVNMGLGEEEDGGHGENGEMDLDDDDDEDEDVDFNPFLRDSPSLEASSSLSSENEGVAREGNDGLGRSSSRKRGDPVVEASSEFREPSGGDDLQTEPYEEVIDGKEAGLCESGKRTRLPSGESQMGGHSEEKDILATEGDASTMRREQELLDQTMDALPDLNISRKPVIHVQNGQGNEEEDDEDAICRRTRARVSLRDLSLDELEMFLQESDEEDYFQNVDDEEEYRKFLAAVIGNPDADGEGNQEANRKEDIEDDDEDDDADFEMEIEAALESDPDESWSRKGRKEKLQVPIHRPETRQKKRQKAEKNKDRLVGSNKPLRPLLPLTANIQVARSSELGASRLLADSVHPFNPAVPTVDANSFTAHQIGQLHCLIYEHVQLLIQVFSLCVLDPARQEIADKAKGLIFELADKCDEALAWKKVPYPDYCFHPPFIHPSVSQVSQMRQNASPVPSFLGASTRAINAEKSFNGHASAVQDNRYSGWTPVVHGHVVSVLDVAPLRIARDYLTGIEAAVSSYKQRRITDMDPHTYYEREPLFHVPNLPCEATTRGTRDGVSPGRSSTPSNSCSQPSQKKTLAGVLVESSKMQSIALVPKDIAQLAQRFLPLFNVDLFPHKPPPAAAVNRVLFTDAEDELLAMGLMMYNSDWKAIQQRFLPCKKINQIFIRQKNRSAAKAPENSIKAVKRMKSSPLSPEEKAYIDQGIKVFKLDWMSIWKYCVPHRDPLLLPRQWRIAIGTQKSYKTTEAAKEKRRLYEAKRRQSKLAMTSNLTLCEPEDNQISGPDGEDYSGNEYDDEDEAYVHEAFLADWRPTGSVPVSPELPVSAKVSDSGRRSQVDASISEEGLGFHKLDASLMQEQSNSTKKGIHAQAGQGKDPLQGHSYMHHFAATASPSSETPTQMPPFTNIRWTDCYLSSRKLISDCKEKSSRSRLGVRPCRMRKTSGLQLVKLAPDLPPVNLPPSVRIIPKAAFGCYPHETSCNLNAVHRKESNVKISEPHFVNTGMISSTNVGKDRNASSVYSSNRKLCTENQNMVQGTSAENGAEADLQMHPLLFQMPGEGSWPHLPNNAVINSRSRNTFPENAFQLGSLFKKRPTLGTTGPHYPAPHSNLSSSSMETIDFHPLLQRSVSVDKEPTSHSHPVINCSASPDSAPVLSDACGTKSQVINLSASSGGHERSDEPNLDFHLHLGGNRMVADGITINRPLLSLKDSRSIKDSQTCNDEGHPSGSHTGLGSFVHSVSSVAVAERRSITDDHGEPNVQGPLEVHQHNQALSEIVMEQEELSDSEDDIRENVEFEHEEMADSEEESHHCQLGTAQSKEASNVEFEEEILSDDENSLPRRSRIFVPDGRLIGDERVVFDHSIVAEKGPKSSRKSRQAFSHLSTSEFSSRPICQNMNKKKVRHSSQKALHIHRSKLKRTTKMVACKSST
ncbi:uncharacterized protein LOC116249792 isoform X1 [Nymphaea colorata]|nr:uncharacterized protein LOC116249792 isoform X1 [Nymphaea colorata]